MRWLIVAEGRLKDRGLRDLADGYLKRIRRHVRCDEIEVKDSNGLRRATPEQVNLVALEVKGRSYTSTEFAHQLESWGRQQKGAVVFVIGGAEGLPSEILQRADAQLSLSTMTLPHRLARVLLLEQLYRGLSIQRNEPYARED